MTATAVSSTNLYNLFPIIKEIIQSSPLATLNTKFAAGSTTNHYYEYDPLIKKFQGIQYPYIVIEVNSDQSSLALQKQKLIDYVVTVTIRVQYVARGSAAEPNSQATVNSYAQAFIQYINDNEITLLNTYNLNFKDITTDTDIVEIDDEEISQIEIEIGVDGGVKSA